MLFLDEFMLLSFYMGHGDTVLKYRNISVFVAQVEITDWPRWIQLLNIWLLESGTTMYFSSVP